MENKTNTNDKFANPGMAHAGWPVWVEQEIKALRQIIEANAAKIAALEEKLAAEEAAKDVDPEGST